MLRNKKRGALELSVNGIVIMILALAFLSMGLIFVKAMIGKLFVKFDEQISLEPEPLKPTYAEFISLSRSHINAKADTVEIVKVSILNPTLQIWNKRQFVTSKNSCGNLDGICFIDKDDPTGKCNDERSAKINDIDCKTDRGCKDNGKKAPCFVSNLEEDFCPDGQDPDCQDVDGIEVYVNCQNDVTKEAFKRNIGTIPQNEFTTSILLLRIKNSAPPGQHLCQVKLFAEDQEYRKDLVLEIEK